MSRYDHPADDSAHHAATQDPQDYCTECGQILGNCHCVATYCLWCGRLYMDATYWPYCSDSCAIHAARD